MKQSNNYISLSHALNLIQNNHWIFRQDLNQSEFKVLRGENSRDWYKLNKKTATELKLKLKELNKQTKVL